MQSKDYQNLRECPFCGNKNPVVKPSMDYGYIVECLQCGASTSWDEVKEEAIELWNERAKPSLPFETIEWHEIKYRDLTEEEKTYYEEHYDYVPDYMFDCHMPDDGDEILIATKYGVDKDVASIDYGCFLEGRGDWEDVIAWAYMPKYKAKENE